MKDYFSKKSRRALAGILGYDTFQQYNIIFFLCIIQVPGS
jgi:hypothetical protein